MLKSLEPTEAPEFLLFAAHLALKSLEPPKGSSMQPARDAGDEVGFTVGFYNLGVQQSMLDPESENRALNRMLRIRQDVADAFHTHSLDMLGLC